MGRVESRVHRRIRSRIVRMVVRKRAIRESNMLGGLRRSTLARQLRAGPGGHARISCDSDGEERRSQYGVVDAAYVLGTAHGVYR